MLWVRAGALVAQQLNVSDPALVGEPVTVANGVGAFSISGTGLVAYRRVRGSQIQRQLAWMDRSGALRGAIGGPEGGFIHPRVSPDGRRVAVTRAVQRNQDVWLLDGTRVSRFTFDAATDATPLWSPDGTRIVFRSERTGQSDLFQKLTTGAGVEERLVASDEYKFPNSWSVDGRFVLYSSIDDQGDTDLWTVPTAGDRMPSVFLKTPFNERAGAFSPDGRWVAYQSNESGMEEIYVRPFVPSGVSGASAQAAGGQWQVSAMGGIHPVWRPDGKELYYLNPDGAMVGVPITVTGTTLEPGAPVVLFPTRVAGGGVDLQQGRQYDVAPDGRFLISAINTEPNSADAPPITLIQNWRPPTN